MPSKSSKEPRFLILQLLCVAFRNLRKETARLSRLLVDPGVQQAAAADQAALDEMKELIHSTLNLTDRIEALRLDVPTAEPERADSEQESVET